MLISGAEITAFVGSWLWPMFRIGGLLMAAPVFSGRNVPMRVRLSLMIMLTMVIAPTLPPVPVIDVFSPVSVFIIAEQILIGVFMGFAVQLVFSAVVVGGQIISMQLGLGFSLMVDPQNGTQTPVLAQYFLLMVVLVYLALDGHLVLIEVLADSFRTMPIAATGLTADNLWQLVTFGGQLFAGGVAIVLPAVASLLVVNLAFGVMTRAAPQLNIFAIGFPITMMLGFALIMITLPGILPQSISLFDDVYGMLRSVIAGS